MLTLPRHHLPMKTTTSIATAAFLGLNAALSAAPLTTARVTKIINDVKLVESAQSTRSAAVNDVVRDQVSVKTGVKSRSELLFEDDTLTRIGPETMFRFTAGTRDMTLDRGAMLLQVPKGIGGATIHTAAITASITGTTIMLENNPGKEIKVVVLEGSLRLSANGRFGDSVVLTPGKMVVMPPDAKRIPEPVTIDLAGLVKTSGLVNMGKKDGAEALPSMSLIDSAIAEQAKGKERADLVAASYSANGHDPKADGSSSATDIVSESDRHAGVVQGNGQDPQPDHGNDHGHGNGGGGH